MILIQNGADVTATDDHEETALHHAALFGNSNVNLSLSLILSI